MTFVTPWQRPTDVEAVLLWSAIFVLISWLLVVLPLIFIIQESSRLLQFSNALIFGAMVGAIIFLLLVGWWTDFWSEVMYWGYAMVVGATIGGAYSTLLHLRGKNIRRVA